MSVASKLGSGSRGSVAAGHELVAHVGAETLEAGGNAVDAVVAMVAAGCVCEGTLTSFGGGGFMIVGGGDDQIAPVLLDFFTRQPGLQARPQLAPWEVHALELDGTVLRYGTGPASVAVPGISRGLAHASRRFGRLSLARALEPSVRLADGGVVLTRTQAGEHSANVPLIVRDPDGAAGWLVDGRPRQLGDLFQQPLLADTIERIGASDGEAAYTGEIGRALLRWSDERHGRISRADIERYTVHERSPLRLQVGDITMLANPEPSMGGIITVQLLKEMLDTAPSGTGDGAARDLAVGSALVRMMRELDPPRTISPTHGELVVHQELDADMSPAQLAAVRDVMHDRGAHTDVILPEAGFSRSPNTTHVSAIDSDGLLAGATTTVGYGAGEFVPGTGIHLNNMLAEYDHTILRMPGATIPSMMTPTLLFTPRTLVQLGSAGSDRIPYAISQILERMWRGVPLQDAVYAPRFAWDGAVVHAEPGLDERALEQLEQHHEVVRWSTLDPYFGTTNGTALRAGSPRAAGDPRREAVGLVL